jgi:hypothetical protein
MIDERLIQAAQRLRAHMLQNHGAQGIEVKAAGGRLVVKVPAICEPGSPKKSQAHLDRRIVEKVPHAWEGYPTSVSHLGDA